MGWGGGGGWIWTLKTKYCNYSLDYIAAGWGGGEGWNFEGSQQKKTNNSASPYQGSVGEECITWYPHQSGQKTDRCAQRCVKRLEIWRTQDFVSHDWQGGRKCSCSAYVVVVGGGGRVERPMRNAIPSRSLPSATEFTAVAWRVQLLAPSAQVRFTLTGGISQNAAVLCKSLFCGVEL